MENVLKLWSTSGLAQMQSGQLLMIVVCMGLLYLAIRKGFEPLLLVPIGFGGILANIPGAGLAMSGVEAAIASANPEILRGLAQALGGVGWEHGSDLFHSFEIAGAEGHRMAAQFAADSGFSDGMLYTFYTVAIGSGAAPLIIFMGVGAMTDFGPLIANPKTLLLGAAAQFGIFATVLGAVSLSSIGVMNFSISDAAAIGIIGGADGPTAIYVSSILAPD
ncbi:MAG: sodium ion-translocating decarboxylase beta subunit, partial [Halieaceae bacterium]